MIRSLLVALTLLIISNSAFAQELPSCPAFDTIERNCNNYAGPNPDVRRISCDYEIGVLSADGRTRAHHILWRGEYFRGPLAGTPLESRSSASCPVAWDRCNSRAPYPATHGANISVCKDGCQFEPDGSVETWSVRGGLGYASRTSGMYRPTGQVCVGLPDTPPLPEDGNLCGGGSCYDSHENKFCAVGSAGQVCIKGPPRGDGPPKPPSGCVTGGDTTLCAGNPPPKPPNPPVNNPVTDIAATDTFGSSGGGNAPTNTTVNNYNTTNSPPNSGAGSGDTSPPPKPGSGSGGEGEGEGNKDPTRASGGGDCHTPPICEGAAATCAVVQQVWLTRCPPGGDGTGGDGDGDGDGDGGTGPGIGEHGEDGYNVSATGRGEVFSDGEGGLGSIDQTSWAGNSCPSLPVVNVFGQPWQMDQGLFCEWLAMIRPVFLLVCGFIALRITASGGKS